jgi:hypothetical protein
MPRVEAPEAERELLLRVLDALDTGLLALDEDRRIIATCAGLRPDVDRDV